MEGLDWEAMATGGTPACWESLRRLESGLRGLEAQVVELKAGLRPGQRMELVWFRRYSELMLALLHAGLPEDLDVGEVAGWIRRRIGGDGEPANKGGGRIELATGWKSEVIADLGGGWKIEAVEVPESETASTIYFHKFQEGEGAG